MPILRSFSHLTPQYRLRKRILRRIGERLALSCQKKYGDRWFYHKRCPETL
ncbi:MAG TPA: hypothetical protein EYN03_03605 [Planctomycetes bacterium]|nr:hypothetical protein [Planctomycetaceae bacterium]HIN94708.1 hypothetical protein [Planctomycetota bacterium]